MKPTCADASSLKHSLQTPTKTRRAATVDGVKMPRRPSETPTTSSQSDTSSSLDSRGMMMLSPPRRNTQQRKQAGEQSIRLDSHRRTVPTSPTPKEFRTRRTVMTPSKDVISINASLSSSQPNRPMSTMHSKGVPSDFEAWESILRRDEPWLRSKSKRTVMEAEPPVAVATALPRAGLFSKQGSRSSLTKSFKDLCSFDKSKRNGSKLFLKPPLSSTVPHHSSNATLSFTPRRACKNMGATTTTATGSHRQQLYASKAQSCRDLFLSPKLNRKTYVNLDIDLGIALDDFTDASHTNDDDNALVGDSIEFDHSEVEIE